MRPSGTLDHYWHCRHYYVSLYSNGAHLNRNKFHYLYDLVHLFDPQLINSFLLLLIYFPLHLLASHLFHSLIQPFLLLLKDVLIVFLLLRHPVTHCAEPASQLHFVLF